MMIQPDREWQPLDPAGADLALIVPESFLPSFVKNHDHADVIRELVQNEYDAGGDHLRVDFRRDALHIFGNGKAIDPAGWRRLSVMAGHGLIPESGGVVKPKVNAIGSKNQGLRSLFLYGDSMAIRSAGLQTIRYVNGRGLPAPQPEPVSSGRPGIEIRIPYRAKKSFGLEPFTVEREEQTLERFAHNLAPTLTKLASPDAKHGLRRLTISSERCGRTITWHQSAKLLAKLPQGGSVNRRLITSTDSRTDRRKSVEELEFQKFVRCSEDPPDQGIPHYFRRPGGRICIALSLRTRRGKLAAATPGSYFHPLGAGDAVTGNGVSICAPFEMNMDRSGLVDSPWNIWLIDRAVELTFELLVSDWYDRFGPAIYSALAPHLPAPAGLPIVGRYLAGVSQGLQTRACWPSRARDPQHPKVPVFAPATSLAVPEIPALEGFLGDRYLLASPFGSDPEVIRVARQSGVRLFTTNSLVALRSSGKGGAPPEPARRTGEARCHYHDFPDPLLRLDLQRQFGAALDACRRRLTKENKLLLQTSSTTLAASGELRAPSALYLVDPRIADGCHVPVADRLHPALVGCKVLASLCNRYDSARWIEDVARKAGRGEATEEERVALYRYLTSPDARIGRAARGILREAPVLRDHRGAWVKPTAITRRSARGAKALGMVLSFPHDDFAANTRLARRLGFRTAVTGGDLVSFARQCAARPELADTLEGTLLRFQDLLTRPVVAQLKLLPCLRVSGSAQLAPPATVYLRTPRNRACLGDSVQYPAGTHAALYQRLECIEKPTVEAIVAHLAALRVTGKKPDSLEVLYPTLVDALKARKLPTARYQSEPILWNGDNFSAPEMTLLGSRLRRTFLASLPHSAPESERLYRAFRELGACTVPSEKHWRELLLWFARRHRAPGEPVPEPERRALREAYEQLPNGLPGGIPDDARCLLARGGTLHSRADARAGRFLINDDPQLAVAATEQGAVIAFADTREADTLPFFAAEGIPTLTQVREWKASVVGSVEPPSGWFAHEGHIARLGTPWFAWAAARVARGELRTREERRDISDAATLSERLGVLSQVGFVSSLQTVYGIGGTDVRVNVDFLIEDSRILLTNIRSAADLDGALAQAVASLMVRDLALQRSLTDPIFRLLVASWPTGVRKYLSTRGIAWEPPADVGCRREATGTGDEHGDGKPGDDDERRVLEILGESLRESATQTGDEPSDNLPGETPPSDPPASSGAVAELPAIEDVTPVEVPPTGSWSPPERRRNSPGGRRTRSAPSAAKSERDQSVGRRGEEIVYRRELERVRQLGYRRPEEKVCWRSATDALADHDIASIDDEGNIIYIEVKSSINSDGRFFWSKAEFDKAVRERGRYILVRVYEAGSATPVIKEFGDPIGLLLQDRMRLDIAELRAEVEPA